jgi:glycosyltransferase involved in cell wall biosynthesis
MFYENVGRWFRRLSAAALRHADLINLPNEEEKSCLQSKGGRVPSITVQPYGLSAPRREAIAREAASVETRLERRKICFLGMWSPRKGSRDWPDILRLIWQQMPEARFSFLGTMVDPETVRKDLGLLFSERIETVPHYSQEELPGLLSDCTVGAFPSYVEGFGIAVLEQLASGIPTVAFEVAGPRDMLGPVSSELLVPPGDMQQFARSIIRILQFDAATYRNLSDRCTATAAWFDWKEIASNTASIYRDRLAATRSVLVSNHGS